MRRTLVRATFAATLLLFPLQAAYASLIAEPYPALVQPPFGAVPHTGEHVTSEDLEITAVFTDGTRMSIAERELFAEVTGISPRFASRLVFGPADDDRRSTRAERAEALLTPPWYDPPADRAGDPATVTWLRGRLAELAPGREGEAVIFRWSRTTHPLDDASVVIDRQPLGAVEVRL